MHAKNRKVFLGSYICESEKWDDKTQEKEERKAYTKYTQSISDLFLDILQLLFVAMLLL